MTKQVLSRCCCCRCATVRTGTIIIGGLCLIGFLSEFIYTFTSGGDATERISTLVFDVLLVLAAILLLVGTFKRTPVLMLPWLIICLLGTIHRVIFWILAAVYCFQHKDEVFNTKDETFHPRDENTTNEATGFTYGITAVFGTLIIIAIGSYVWLVVYSHYTELKNEKKRGHVVNRPYA